MHLHTSIFPKKGRGGKAGRHSGREQLSIIIRFRSVLKCRNGNEVRAHKLSVEFFQTALSPFPHFPPTGTAANRAPNRILFNFRRPRIFLMSFLTCTEELPISPSHVDGAPNCAQVSSPQNI